MTGGVSRADDVHLSYRMRLEELSSVGHLPGAGSARPTLASVPTKAASRGLFPLTLNSLLHQTRTCFKFNTKITTSRAPCTSVATLHPVDHIFTHLPCTNLNSSVRKVSSSSSQEWNLPSNIDVKALRHKGGWTLISCLI